jgi:hypothetical protein
MPTSQSEYPIIFVGPSIPFADIQNEISAICLPPAAQGSIVMAVERYSPSAILLIDGNFQTEPAIRHKEILWALSQGIHVFGASSMGALRAAELWRYGMVGVGLAYRWYRRFPLLRDDAVAVLHAPAELGYRPFTNSLIDLRMTTRAAFRRGLISSDVREALDQAASKIGFRDRTLANIIKHAFGRYLVSSVAEETKSALEKCRVDQKHADSLTALRLLHRMRTAGELRRQPKKAFTMTTAFRRDLEFAGIKLP